MTHSKDAKRHARDAVNSRSGTVVKTTAVVVSRNGSLGAAAVVLAFASFIAASVVWASSSHARYFAVLVWNVTSTFGVATAIAWASYLRPERREVLIEATSAGLSIDGKLKRRARELTGGAANVVSEQRVQVDLRAVYRPKLRLDIETVAKARDLLAALGLDRRTGTSKFRARRINPDARRFVRGASLLVAVALVVCAVSVPLGLGLLSLAVATPIVLRLLGRVAVVVGSDGIDLRSPVAHTFLPHAHIRSIRKIWSAASDEGARRLGKIAALGFEIALDDGTLFELDTTERFAADVWLTDPVFDASFDAWTASRRQVVDVPAQASTQLARRERSISEWIATLRALAVDAGGGYRVAPLDAAALFDVLSDAEAPRELRAAAAVVLGASKAHAPRLRVGVDDLADPIVRRVALTSVTSDAEGAATRLEEELEAACAEREPRAW